MDERGENYMLRCAMTETKLHGWEQQVTKAQDN